VIVCSYNGARTLAECCAGLRALDYPNYEVIVVDDGSTDTTASIARQYGYRVISTENRGLSSARNTGLAAASGEIVAYLDDDAYPDPHWLTYLAIAFQTTAHAGLGGPNIAPPGDGVIADCVANAPGGPVHVLVGDQEAEHIPGCNMAFRKAQLQAIGGFDPQFRVAGDDVDVCWRIQQQGWTIGFCPAAMVWHHRRNSVRAFWKQQRGYGRAEALLERKWPEKYNAAGQITWAGRIYGKGLWHDLVTRQRIYHGTWGSRLFQSIYEPAPSKLWALPRMPEWYLVTMALGLLSILGVTWQPLFLALPMFVLAGGMLLLQAGAGAAHASFSTPPQSRSDQCKLWALTALLYLLQPLARLWGRLSYGLTPWRRWESWRPALPRPRISTWWSGHWQATDERLKLIEATIRQAGVVRRGGDFDRWDLEVRTGLLGAARVIMTVQDHDAGVQLIRLRSWPKYPVQALLLALVLGGLAMWAGIDQQWAIAGVLGGGALLLALRIGQECAAATCAVDQALENTETKGAS
jgi:GT2 family glycosyltransferase